MTPVHLHGLRDVLGTAASRVADAAAMADALATLDALPAAEILQAKIRLVLGGGRREEWLTLPVTVEEVRARLRAELGRQFDQVLAGMDVVQREIREAGARELAGGV